MTGRDAAYDVIGTQVELRHHPGGVQRDVEVAAAGIHDQVTRSAPDAVDVGHGEVGEVDLCDLGRSHDRDVGHRRVGIDGDATRIGTHVQLADLLAGRDRN